MTSKEYDKALRESLKEAEKYTGADGEVDMQAALKALLPHIMKLRALNGGKRIDPQDILRVMKAGDKE